MLTPVSSTGFLVNGSCDVRSQTLANRPSGIGCLLRCHQSGLGHHPQHTGCSKAYPSEGYRVVVASNMMNSTGSPRITDRAGMNDSGVLPQTVRRIQPNLKAPENHFPLAKRIRWWHRGFQLKWRQKRVFEGAWGVNNRNRDKSICIPLLHGRHFRLHQMQLVRPGRHSSTILLDSCSLRMKAGRRLDWKDALRTYFPSPCLASRTALPASAPAHGVTRTSSNIGVPRISWLLPGVTGYMPKALQTYQALS